MVDVRDEEHSRWKDSAFKVKRRRFQREKEAFPAWKEALSMLNKRLHSQKKRFQSEVLWRFQSEAL